MDYRAEAAKADDDATKNLAGATETLSKRISDYIAMPMAQITAGLRSAEEYLKEAKAGYDALLGCNADAQVLADAKSEMKNALDRFATVYGIYSARPLPLPTKPKKPILRAPSPPPGNC